MRIALGAVILESNTFSPVPATLEHFRSIYYWLGEAIPQRLRDSSTEVSGFYDVLEETGHQLVPTVAAMGVSGGRLTETTYELLRDQLLERMLAGGLPGAVLLALHGAMCTEREDDGDSRLLADVRREIGNAVPLFVTHDLHANVTRRRVQLCHALVGYHTAPHVDHRATGARAARLLLRTLATGQLPQNFLVKVPMIAPSVRMNTAIPPLRDIVGRAQQLERNARTPSVSPFWMQPWLDVSEAGAAVNVVCYGSWEDAAPILKELGEAIWETRHELDVRLWPAGEAIRDAVSQPRGPCVFSDTGDAPPGGAPGDSNYLLKTFLEEGVTQPVLLTLLDAAAARAMHAAGAGSVLKIALGGSIDGAHFQPHTFEGKVARLSQGRFTYEGPIAGGQPAEMGLAAVFEIGSLHVLVHERPAFSHDPVIFRSVGLEPLKAQIVVAKTPTQFRACYEPMAHKIYEIETPGVCDVNLRRLGFHRVPRPMYPFDPECEVEKLFFSSGVQTLNKPGVEN